MDLDSPNVPMMVLSKMLVRKIPIRGSVTSVKNVNKKSKSEKGLRQKMLIKNLYLKSY